MTPLPEDDVAAVRAWCAARVPAHARHQVFVECEITDRHLTIVERRLPYWADRSGAQAQADASPQSEIEWTRFPVARLRFTRTRSEWALYWRDQHLRFHRHEHVPSTTRVADLLDAINDDRSGIFFG